MSFHDEAAGILRAVGLRVTPQRMVILRVIREAEGHLSASQVAERVHEEFPTVDLSTVYRTLEVMKAHRLVTATDLGEGDMLYEWTDDGEPHHHTVCTSCGRIQEIAHRYLDEIGGKLEQDFGFEANLDHFAIFGKCAGCRPKAGQR